MEEYTRESVMVKDAVEKLEHMISHINMLVENKSRLRKTIKELKKSDIDWTYVIRTIDEMDFKINYLNSELYVMTKNIWKLRGFMLKDFDGGRK